MGGAAESRGERRELSSQAARPATVWASNSSRSGTSRPRADRIREARRVASSEWPPSSKKLSRGPTSTPSTSDHRPHSTSSRGEPGASTARSPARQEAGSGRRRRSTLPFGVSGSAGSATRAEGTM